MSSPVSTSKASEYNKWEAEEDLRTITRAREIQKDKPRMARVRRAAREKLGEMSALKDLAAGKS